MVLMFVRRQHDLLKLFRCFINRRLESYLRTEHGFEAGRKVAHRAYPAIGSRYIRVKKLGMKNR
ncbi:hypothetical protein HanRHA438_Chr10g0444551 [Helianthus annuus]|uniref:Uncharacterized protein n=1 Tax=Helianthus annuus TaxID=4232 RepID=A0A251TI90_HELAN|nr:hypothetical protein HanRHA438_Chr10g0444551 [Helianthus annuus]